MSRFRSDVTISEITRLIAEGKSIKEVADLLDISQASVYARLKNAGYGRGGKSIDEVCTKPSQRWKVPVEIARISIKPTDATFSHDGITIHVDYMMGEISIIGGFDKALSLSPQEFVKEAIALAELAKFAAEELKGVKKSNVAG